MELFSSQMVLFQTLSQGPLKPQTSVRQSSCFEGPHHLTGEDRQTSRELLRNTGTRVVNQMGHTREVWSRTGGEKDLIAEASLQLTVDGLINVYQVASGERPTKKSEQCEQKHREVMLLGIVWEW